MSNPVVSEDEYLEAVDGSIGWCPDCGEFTRDCTEPDAENYTCEVCENSNVVGAENALVMDMITIE
jgi:hypothetical protein